MNEPVWLWFNLLSLDAPIVALVWQDFLARCYPAVIRPSSRVVLGLTVWAIYLADRLIDARHPAAENEPARHRFARRYGRFSSGLLIAVLIADAVIGAGQLRPVVLSGGLPLCLAVAGYLALFAWKPGIARDWKHPCAALLFTAGVFLVVWRGTTGPWRVLLWPACAFWGLCWGNMVMAERSELGTAEMGWVPMVALALISAWAGHTPWYVAIAISSACLAGLDLLRKNMSREAGGVLADAVLLSPLLLGLGR